MVLPPWETNYLFTNLLTSVHNFSPSLYYPARCAGLRRLTGCAWGGELRQNRLERR